MTFLIDRTSNKSDRAVRFGRELEKAMKTRGVGTRPVADAIGSSRTSVMYWRTGRILPRLDTAKRLSEALDWPRIASLASELRMKPCDVCNREFIDDSGSDNRQYCSPGCQRVAEKRRQGVSTDHRADMAERRLLGHRRAVAAFCRACEPEGACADAQCALRPVSPLPLRERRDEVMPIAKAKRGRAA